MTDQREQSGSFDLVSRTVDEAEKRMIKVMRPDIERMSAALERLSLDVHDLKVRREVDTTSKAVADVQEKHAIHGARIDSLEQWRAFARGAIAILSFLAVTFGVLAYQTLSSVEKDVAVLKARGE